MHLQIEKIRPRFPLSRYDHFYRADSYFIPVPFGKSGQSSGGAFSVANPPAVPRKDGWAAGFPPCFCEAQVLPAAPPDPVRSRSLGGTSLSNFEAKPAPRDAADPSDSGVTGKLAASCRGRNLAPALEPELGRRLDQRKVFLR